MSTRETGTFVRPIGAALAAFVAAGIGVFAMGLISFLDATGILAVPALYDPAGGVTGRTALAVLVWLVAWAVLHSRWKLRDGDARRAHLITVVLTLLGILLAFPGIWALFS